MPVYRFQALTPDGRIIKDQMEFPDLRSFYTYLRREGLILVRYSARPALPWDRFTLGKVSRPELAEFCHNLALLVRGGIPLPQALKDLRETTVNPRLKKALGVLLTELQAGNPLSRGMEKEKDLFPGIVRSLTALGEETGRLDHTLEEASRHLRRLHEIITQTKRAMLYPLFVLVAMSGALLFWLLFVLPKILNLFSQMRVTLPAPTRFLLFVTTFLRAHFLEGMLFLFVSLLFLWVGYRRFPAFKLRMEKVLLRLPIVSRIKRSSLLAFFFEYMALLLGAGIDILRSFDIMYSNIQSELGKKIIKELKEGVLRGESLSSTAAGLPLFSPLDLRMISVGEETGTLVDQLRELARYYYEIIQGLVDTLSRILEPVLIVIVGVIFLLIVIALIGPIYELITQIH
ncbi:type II secretion system F family protein [Thermosulfurimonas sp.]|uniref:type II secretion system F family protein n=1 Tax=Thermosulfurimonas sp. TaxID=2080236 RepID=UPI0025DCFF94|nr:type II secretion system F family protein [Thermosulfurimonas sp.]